MDGRDSLALKALGFTHGTHYALGHRLRPWDYLLCSWPWLGFGLLAALVAKGSTLGTHLACGLGLCPWDMMVRRTPTTRDGSSLWGWTSCRGGREKTTTTTTTDGEFYYGKNVAAPRRKRRTEGRECGGGGVALPIE